MKTSLSTFWLPIGGARVASRFGLVGAVGIAFSLSLAGAADNLVRPDPAKTEPAIAWPQIGAKVNADYKGSGLAILPTADGARLCCIFQRLEGEATLEGLWLSSTVEGRPRDKFRVIATAVGREGEPAQSGSLVGRVHAPTSSTPRLEETGTVSVHGQTVRFTRPGLVEEYTVSMDGLRQDFVVLERPAGAGELSVQLSMSGVRVNPTTGAVGGARLVLENSGRAISYSRMRVTDAVGKELPARIEAFEEDESHGNSITQPSIASLRAAMGQTNTGTTTLKGFCQSHAAMLAVIVNDADAAYPVRIDPTFSDGNWCTLTGIPGANERVNAIVPDGSGNLYIAGDFSLVGDVIANRVARWNGRSWTAVGSVSDGPNSSVHALVVSGNSLYAGGSFTTAGAKVVNCIAQWNGSSWTALGTGLVGSYPSVNALAVFDNSLYAGGYFTNAGGSAAINIAKWDGSNWSPLGSGLVGVNSSVHALAVFDGNLYAGGYFTNADGSGAKYIARWDGSRWSQLGSGVDQTVDALAVASGELYVGGRFTTAGGSAASYLAKWDGSNWTSLGPGTSSYGYVEALAVSGAEVYGAFCDKLVAKWELTGWSVLGSGVTTSHGSCACACAVAASDGNIYVGGNFTIAGDGPANGIARWDGSTWSALGSGIGGLDPYVYALAVSGTNVYAAGRFLTTGIGPPGNIARWDGSSWTALGSGVNGEVHALVQSGPDLYVGGLFTMAGQNAANCIAKWNGSTWTSLGSGMNNYVFALAVSRGVLYAGGSFTVAGGRTAHYMAAWNGSNWTALASELNNGVVALAASGSDVYAGGDFTAAGGIPANYLAKWNGSNWTSIGSGVGFVNALLVLDSDLYAGGDSTVAKWNGTTWTALGSRFNERVLALAAYGSEIYAGGYFTTEQNAPSFVAKWDGSSWTRLGSGLGPGPGFFPGAAALAVSGKDLYVGGNFNTAGGKVSAYVARGYLPDLPALSIRPASTDVTVSWSSQDAADFALEQASTLSAPANWGTNSANMINDGTNTSVTIPATNSPQFFRLRRQ